jgi:hypothetical protein
MGGASIIDTPALAAPSSWANPTKLDRLAETAVKVGLRLQPGQDLFLTAGRRAAVGAADCGRGLQGRRRPGDADPVEARHLGLDKARCDGDDADAASPALTEETVWESKSIGSPSDRWYACA